MCFFFYRTVETSPTPASGGAPAVFPAFYRTFGKKISLPAHQSSLTRLNPTFTATPATLFRLTACSSSSPSLTCPLMANATTQMTTLSTIYSTSLGLLTDQYELAMAFGYWKSGRAEDEAVFDLFYRSNPFGSGYCIACGLQSVIEFIENYGFTDDDVAFLRTLTGADERPLFNQNFLDYLRNLRFTCTIDAVPEGTVVFPNEPILRVRGPLLQCQLLEAPLLTITNFQTLIATKASRIVHAARGESVLEFGLRRAQGIDGALSASRASYIGGCAATSNTLAGKLYGIPVSGTQSHSWVMSFDSEKEAFETFAEVMPNNVVLLVDTYDTLRGVRRAAAVGQQLRHKGHRLLGIRLDSGDLAELSRQARDILDDAGLSDTRIYGSDEMDEHAIAQLKAENARISMWGVGTRLVTAYDDPALGGVYKLVAIRPAGSTDWRYPIKVSDDEMKGSLPGIHQVRRFFSSGRACGDMVYDTLQQPEREARAVLPQRRGMAMRFGSELTYEDLLQPVYDRGERRYVMKSIRDIREYAAHCLSEFDDHYIKISAPDSYPIGVEEGLHKQRTALLQETKASA